MSRIKKWLRQRFPGAVSTFHGYRHTRALRRRAMRMTPRGFHLMGHQGMEDGTFEPDEAVFIQEFSKPGAVFVDVGANFGYFVCIALQRGAHVLAIEPFAQNLEVLYANLEANGWSELEVFPVGLGSTPGVAQLFGGGTSASIVERWAGQSEVWKRTIALSTLDIVLGDRFADQPLLIKIDVEGYELPVLKGAARTLRRKFAPVWLVEICLTENHPAGANPHFEEIFQEFWSSGYRARTFGETSREVTAGDVARWTSTGHRDFGGINFIFERTDEINR
jgi:FkbM family methyltransferase